jgi:hypothetical protein
VNLIDRRKLGYVCVMRNNRVLKNDRGKDIQFKGAAPNDYRHFINKILQKPRRLNLKYMSAVNNDNKTNGNRYNSVLPISGKNFIANSNSNCCSR